MPKLILSTTILYFSFYFLAFQASAQQQNIDSLQLELVKVTSDSSKIAIINQISFSYYSIHPDSTIRWGKRAIALASNKPYLSLLAQAYRVTGIGYDIKGNYKESTSYFQNALTYFKEAKDSLGMAQSLKNMGITFFSIGVYDKSLELYLQAVEIMEQLSDKNVLASIYNNIGLVYERQKQVDKAIGFYDKALVLWKVIQNKKGITQALNNLGSAYAANQHYEKAIEITTEAMTLQDAIGDLRGKAISLHNLGNFHFKFKQYAKAESFFQQAIQLRLEKKDSVFLGGSFLRLAVLYTEMGQLQKAKQLASQAVAIAQVKKQNELLVDFYQTLSEIAKKQKQYDAALLYFTKAASLKDSINNDKLHWQLASMSADFEFRKKEAEILSKQEAEKQKVKLEIAEQRMYIGLLIAGASFLLLLVTIISISIYKIRKNNLRLNNSNWLLASQKLEIEKQKEKIQELNQNLEIEVEKRTTKLNERNQQLERYAHFNSHSLRGPIASLLGLFKLYKLTNKPEDQQVLFEKAGQCAEDVDKVIREMQNLLDSKD
ncbi:MAG: tetratricopeptide repeat protein [Cyclobacteriaceae bacterium]|nr:tetratricopeptide repeat protein [Cyclobacteriaceae bacterium]